MTNKYLLLVVVIVSGVMAVYGVYSCYYSIGDSPESLTNETGNNTTNGYSETDMPGLNESNNNRTSRSTVSISIPLEKPPFIE